MGSFDRHRYERPSQKWVCGKAAEGQSCRIGPDAKGNCRATFECQPFLEKKEGETKGHYRCTRPKEYGGPCETGPLPNGACARPIPKCQPELRLRARRGAFTFAVFAATLGFLLLALSSSFRLRFINPGPIASAHSSERFMQMHAGNSTNHCAGCHKNADLSAASWLGATFRGAYALSQIDKLATPGPPALHALDQSCLECHNDAGFHHRNVVQNHSCSACHREHRGESLALTPGDAACARCHNDAESMRISRAATFASFAEGHPEFARLRSRDTNTLKFNHHRHFAADIPLIGGKQLQCATCHAPNSSGVAHNAISFENHCQSCHSLQFDRRNPDLHVPHADVSVVRAFLRSLPVQYGDYARRHMGINQERELNEFVRAQLIALREEMRSEDRLETTVLRACSLCHELSENGGTTVTAPSVPDRWLSESSFNHATHASLQCTTCHGAERSRDTADILMPSVATCVECHSPRGGVTHNCALCHNFHRSPRP